MSDRADCWNTAGVRGAATCERLAAVAHCRNCPDYVAAARKLLDREVPESAAEEWARLIAEPKQARRRRSLSVVAFRLGAEWLALKTVLFEQAVTARPVHCVPARTNRIFLGLVNIDGELLLCFSAAEALAPERESSNTSARRNCERLLVVSQDGQRLAFPVDEVLGVRLLAEEELAPAPATVSNAPDAVTTAVFSVDERRISLLDEARFLQRLMRSLTL